MSAEKLRALLRRRPFEPFTLLLADGSRADVRDPASVIVAKSKATVGLLAHRDQARDEELARVRTVQLEDIVQVVPRAKGSTRPP